MDYRCNSRGDGFIGGEARGGGSAEEGCVCVDR
jgi:hypothetical protein